jgi:hypothetical protein
MGWITALLASGPARKALGLLLAALTIVLFLLNLRRAGERAGRLAERLSTTERTHEIQSHMLDAAPIIVTLLLNACVIGGSDTQSPCPPAVEYSAAEEVGALPEGAVVVAMLSDYAVLRDQARARR